MFVGGEWVDSHTRATFNVANPATGEVVDSVPKGDREDVKAAVDYAKQAFRKWSETPSLDHSRVLFKTAELIRANLEDLAKTLTIEQGKPVGAAQVGVCELSRVHGNILMNPVQYTG